MRRTAITSDVRDASPFTNKTHTHLSHSREGNPNGGSDDEVEFEWGGDKEWS